MQTSVNICITFKNLKTLDIRPETGPEMGETGSAEQRVRPVLVAWLMSVGQRKIAPLNQVSAGSNDGSLATIRLVILQKFKSFRSRISPFFLVKYYSPRRE